jgi:DNA modification methylase
MNQLILGDCLEVLKKLDSESVDLIYLDPPFFSNRNYEVIWGDKGEVRSFEDRWSGGVDHYIAWLKERVEQMHRVLKPTGSIFLHCDWHANAYIRTLILDKVFGYENFKGEIIWQRTFAHNDAIKKLPILKDTIWYYSKTAKFIYNPLYAEYSEKYKSTAFSKNDEKGNFQLITITGAGINKNDEEWHGHHPKNVGRHWTVPQKAIRKYLSEEEIISKSTNEKLEILYQKGDIVFSKNGVPRLKSYLSEGKGTLLGEIWIDIPNVSSQSKERIGYPTQKPEALLERIINMASNEGDIVLDPFVGGGTTVAVADRLNRQWIGIDSSVAAIKVTQFRLEKKQTDIFAKPFTVQLHKYDYDTLRYKDAFEFEKFIVQQFGGVANAKQRNDLGLDGKTQDGTPIQVKRSDDIGRNPIDNFKSACERFDKSLFDKNKSENKPIGVIIAFSFGKGAIQEVARLKNQESLIFQLVKVEDIVPIEKKPILRLAFDDLGLDAKKLREIAFSATASSNSGIEFYAWDFNYTAEKGFQADIMIDKTGIQTQRFKAGTYRIAVKVVDNDGLESIEVITLKVNGQVQLLTEKP